MPRIPDELIERIKHEVPLERLGERAGVEWKRHGENLVGLCLFHDDKNTPNLVITPSKNVFHCFVCGAAGSPIDWTMKLESLRFREAVEVLLLEFFPTEARELGLGVAPKRPTVPQLPSPIDLDASEEEAFDGVALYYHQTLKETPEALAYLERRGIATSETIAHFKLGFADRSLGTRLPLMNRKSGASVRTRLQNLGLYRANGREHFRGCLTVPLFDVASHVVGMYGRRIDSHLSADAPRHLYVSGVHRGILNREAFSSSKELILCEAPIDAMTFWRWGLRNVAASYGAEGFTEELFEAFISCAIERVFIAYDRDDAGEKGARKVAEKLTAAGIECFRVFFPKGMDANDVALKMSPPEKTLAHFVRSAEPMGAAGPRVATRATKDEPSSLPLAASDDERDGAAKKEKLSESAPEAGSEPLDPSPTFRFAQAAAVSDAGARGTQILERSPEASARVALVTSSSACELVGDDEAVFRFEDRRYRVQGLKKALTRGSLHVVVHAEREGDFFAPPSPVSGSFLDRFDFVSALARQRFEKNAALELAVKPELVKWDLGQVLRKLEELQRAAIEEALKPKVLVPVLSDEERAEALELASAEDLVERILADYDSVGVAGEKTNKLVGTLAAISRLASHPLAVVIRSSSAAGKTALMDAVLRFMPKEAREKYSAVSGHALFYFEGKDFKHKVLAIVEEEGARGASYALKLLQSDGEITIASTGKDPGTGRLVTKEYRVEGPVMIFLSSTQIDIDDELLNRAVVLTVDEGREQTRRIHELQRFSQTLEGLWAEEKRAGVYRRHHNLQRLLRPLPAVNPYVRELTFLDDRTRTRRDHTKYLGLIEASALLHQYQRPIKSETWSGKTKEYVEVDLFDVALANRLAAEVLGRSLDELGPQTRRLLMLLDDMVSARCEEHGLDRSDVRFARRDIRAFTGWCDSQLRIHLARLIEMEYVLSHGGGRGQTFVYELLYDGQGKDGTPFLIGLADVAAIAKARGLELPRQVLEPLASRMPENGPTSTPRTSPNFSTTSRGHRPAIAPPLPKHRGVEEPAREAAREPISPDSRENAHQERRPNSYEQGGRSSRRPLVRLNLLRFPPQPRTSSSDGNGHEKRSRLRFRQLPPFSSTTRPLARS